VAHSLDAVICALLIQERLRVGIGVNLGDVICEEDGDLSAD
jgi:hypothetical protein